MSCVIVKRVRRGIDRRQAVDQGGEVPQLVDQTASECRAKALTDLWVAGDAHQSASGVVAGYPDSSKSGWFRAPQPPTVNPRKHNVTEGSFDAGVGGH